MQPIDISIFLIDTFGDTCIFLISKKNTENKIENVRNFFLLLFNYSCMSFPPFSPPQPQLNTPPSPTPTPPRFCPCVLYNSSCNALFPLSPPHSPLATARLFPPSMSLVVFCLLFSFVDYVPVRKE